MSLKQNTNITDLYMDKEEFNKGYHHITNSVKDQNGDYLQIPTTLKRWKNYFCLHGINDVRHRNAHN